MCVRPEFVRVHPDSDWHLSAYILELTGERETYLVMPGLAAALPGETRHVNLRLAVSRQGSVFLWPVPEPTLDGRETGWAASARAAVAAAERKWVRIIPNMHQGAYDLYTAPGDLGVPIWPDEDLRCVLTVAFGEKFIIRDLGHPVVKRLRGLG